MGECSLEFAVRTLSLAATTVTRLMVYREGRKRRKIQPMCSYSEFAKTRLRIAAATHDEPML